MQVVEVQVHSNGGGGDNDYRYDGTTTLSYVSAAQSAQSAQHEGVEEEDGDGDCN